MAKNKIQVIGKVTSESVEKHTGKNWDYWITQLSKLNAQALTHKEIAVVLKIKFKVKPWWQHVVATGFEVHTGRKKEGQNEKGEYQVTVTKSLDVSQKKCWDFLNSEPGLQTWLKPMSEFSLQKGESFEVMGEIFGEVRTIQAPLKVRLRWEDPDWPKKSVVQIYIAPRPKNKCILIFMHENLASARVKESMRGYWKERLAEVVTALKVPGANKK